MNVVKLYRATDSNARISVPVEAVRLLGWEHGDKITVEIDKKKKSIIFKALKDVEQEIK